MKNEVMEMIAKVRERKGRLDLPIVSGKRKFRTRADSITDNKAGLGGWMKKFNVNFIVNTSVFLYN